MRSFTGVCAPAPFLTASDRFSIALAMATTAAIKVEAAGKTEPFPYPSQGDFMDIRFVTSGGGDAVAIMGGEGGQLFAAGQTLDASSNGRIGKALKAARFTGAAGQAVDVFAPDGVDYERVVVIGVGKPDAADGMAVER